MEINGICRICLCDMLQIQSVSVFDKLNIGKTILQVMGDIACIEVSEEDCLPKFICVNCYQQLLSINSFRELILFSNIQLKQRIFNESNSYQNESTVDSSSSGHDVVIKNENCDNKDILPLEIYIKEEPREEPQLEEPTSKNVLETDNCSMDNCFKEMPAQNIYVFNDNITTESPNNEKNIISKKSPKELKCEICGKIVLCQSVSDLESHMVVHSDITNYDCEFCPKKFKYRIIYMQHRSLHIREKAMMCLICGMSFESYPKLCSHRATHRTSSKMKIKKFKCDSCNIKSFHRQKELEDHKRSVHTGEKPFLCELCGGAYSSQPLLNKHRMVVHEKTEKCDKCDRMYSTNRIKSHLKLHQDREMGIKPFACEKCGQRFTCSQSLKRHYVIHAGIRPYSCEVCKKSFTQKEGVINHRKVHSDVRKFICEYCPKTFKFKQHLQIHTAKYHNKDDELKASKQVEEICSSTGSDVNSSIIHKEDES